MILLELTDISCVRELMNRRGLSFQKKFGQNFLINPEIPRKIALSCAKSPQILEIGPGIGTLTKELAFQSERVVAVEIDNGLIPLLGETLSEFDNVRIIHGDFLKLDLKKLISENFDASEDISVCANLPYYITTPVIMALLESRIKLSSITVMVQKEVASRLCASPGSSEYGAITLSVNYFSEVEKLFDVSRGNFLPAPKVDSTVIKMNLRKSKPFEVNEKIFFSIIKAAFSQRRKTLLNALSALYSKDLLKNTLSEIGIPLTERGENLSIYEFSKIAQALPPQIKLLR